eukprot:TRINITY_DN3815_c0_g1_i2.p2 TRINITY_DN3815_c0_g1~~TRINITY_DN3815_c0_g1_i2.p2  ORF type:complete len:219 (+),score=67.00 TRINITY_DN3815_c0_g1_i2:958-1614(+)
MATRTTRSKSKRENADKPAEESDKKQKNMTLGQHLFLTREEDTNAILEDDQVSAYEVFSNYGKQKVIEELNAVEEDSGKFGGQIYVSKRTGKEDLIIRFLNLKKSGIPDHITHMCNAEKIKWNLEDLNLNYVGNNVNTGVGMLFVRGEDVKDTNEIPETYKYMGLVGTQGLSSDGGKMHSLTLIIDYVISRKELAEQFGGNVLKCKKNRYGATLCSKF